MKGLQQQQARSLKPLQPDIQQQKQAQKKCPRCDSLNTKFCYYNNYSLSQPRYFCKACRRYWTQGGTLRNIPVGGGCRREKRHKIAPSAGEPRDQIQPQLQQAPCSAIDRISCSTAGILTSSSSSLWIQESQNMASPVIAPSPSTTCIYHPCGELFSSLAAIQSFNHPNIGSDFGKNPSLDLLRGFSLSSSSSSQRHLQQQSQISQRGDGDENVHHLFPSEGNVLEPNSPTSHQEWNRSFINTSNSMSIGPGYRSSIHGATTSTTTTVTGSSFNASQWPDIPGYGPPPSSSTPHL